MTTPAETSAFEAARKYRFALKEAIAAAEAAVAAPASAETWRVAVANELADLRGALHQHVTEVESEDGLLADLLADAPRLANAIREVRDEHPPLCRKVDEVIDLAARDAPAADVRDAVMETLAALSRHRQRGADLVWEAYDVDIGGG